MNEKEKIEEATAEAFLKEYNSLCKKTFQIIKHTTEKEVGPDFECEDDIGDKLTLEVTLTEDRPDDIKAMLGRSDHKSGTALEAHLKQVREGEASIFDSVSCLQGNVIYTICCRIKKKLLKDYGSNVALVIRDTSPVGWDWDSVINDIKEFVEGGRNPYDRGIWIVSYAKDHIYHVL